jgi:hypothetical protein
MHDELRNVSASIWRHRQDRGNHRDTGNRHGRCALSRVNPALHAATDNDGGFYDLIGCFRGNLAGWMLTEQC